MRAASDDGHFARNFRRRFGLTPGGLSQDKARRPASQRAGASPPSIAVAAARRSTLPSGLRGTASTAHSRSGAL